MNPLQLFQYIQAEFFYFKVFILKKKIFKEMRKKTFPFYLKLGGEICISNETLNQKLKEIWKYLIEKHSKTCLQTVFKTCLIFQQ